MSNKRWEGWRAMCRATSMHDVFVERIGGVPRALLTVTPVAGVKHQHQAVEPEHWLEVEFYSDQPRCGDRQVEAFLVCCLPPDHALDHLGVTKELDTDLGPVVATVAREILA